MGEGVEGTGAKAVVEQARARADSSAARAVRAAASRWTRGRVPAALAVLTAGLLVFHRAVPNSGGRPGSLLESFLPWLGLVVVVLLGLALLRRSALALVTLLLPVAAWTHLFGGLLLPGAKPGAHDLLVVQHNVSDENPDPAGTARALADAGPTSSRSRNWSPRPSRSTRGPSPRGTRTTRSGAPSGSGRGIR